MNTENNNYITNMIFNIYYKTYKDLKEKCDKNNFNR